MRFCKTPRGSDYHAWRGTYFTLLECACAVWYWVQYSSPLFQSTVYTLPTIIIILKAYTCYAGLISLIKFGYRTCCCHRGSIFETDFLHVHIHKSANYRPMISLLIKYKISFHAYAKNMIAYDVQSNFKCVTILKTPGHFVPTFEKLLWALSMTIIVM